jgi:hypothetical protein
MATCSLVHFGDASSRRRTSTTFVLTTIFDETSSPTPMSRYAWYARAKQ